MSAMKMMNIAALISVGLMMQGCIGGKETILPQDGPTMKEVYEGHFNGQPAEQKPTLPSDSGKETGLPRWHESSGQNLTDYTRTAGNEVQQIFPRLKNKTLVMYIFPHLSRQERHPVPGYSTAFTMYKETEYALPGEVSEGY